LLSALHGDRPCQIVTLPDKEWCYIMNNDGGGYSNNYNKYDNNDKINCDINN